MYKVKTDDVILLSMGLDGETVLELCHNSNSKEISKEKRNF